MSYVLLQITVENKKLAKAFMEEYKRGSYGKNVLGVTEEKFYEFIYYGKLGELVFRDYLNSNEVQFECKDILKPYPGPYKREGSDFRLLLTNETVDVKTVEGQYKTRLLVREDQFSAKQHDVYVGQRIGIDPDTLECWGYVTGRELTDIEPDNFGYGPCRHLYLSDLYSIEEFIAKAKKGEKF